MDLMTDLRKACSFLKEGDKVRATFLSKNKQRTYIILGELYKVVWSPSGLYLGNEVCICYTDYDGILIPHPDLKKIRKVR